jgi:hypothetical protein
LRRVAIAFACGLAAFIAVYTVAWAFGIPGHDLAAGDGSVASCDTNGPGGGALLTIDGFTLNGSGQITQVTIGDIGAACTGGQLTVHLTSSTQASLAVGTATVTAPTMTVNVTGAPDPHDVKHEAIIIVGP